MLLSVNSALAFVNNGSYILLYFQLHRQSLQEDTKLSPFEVFRFMWCPGKICFFLKQAIVQKFYLRFCNSLKFDFQNLSDEGLSCIAKCKNIVSLNLTWWVKYYNSWKNKQKSVQSFYYLFIRCVRVTDVGVIAIAEGCTSLEFIR